MITAKDVQKKKFEKVKFGYSPEEVDAFLSQIENDLRLMQQDMDDSNEKIQLLADKVREYKDTEEDLKNALLLAQRQARQVIAEAQEKADAIEAEARASVESVKSQALADSEETLRRTNEELEQSKTALERTKKQVAEFKQTLFGLYKQHLELISRLPDSFDEEEEEYEETEETEVIEEAAEAAAEAVEETAADAADSFDDVAQSTFGSRRDDFKPNF